jgi:broad-specificity NMP kinase
MTCEPADTSRMWRTADAVHLDLRDLASPELDAAILDAIDAGTVDCALIAHVDSEPITLYPELEDRGWSHEFVEHHHGGGAEGRHCDGSLQIRMVRWGAA